jgi:hypothetical protein
VGELAEGLGPGHGELARLAERADRLAQLLHPGQPDPAAAHLDHEGADPVVRRARRRPSMTSGSLARRRDMIADSGSVTGPSPIAVGQVELEDQRRGLALP